MPPQTYNDFFSPVSTETAHSGIDELITAGEFGDPGSISAADPWWNKYTQAKESLGDWMVEMFPPSPGVEPGTPRYEEMEDFIRNLPSFVLPNEKWELPLYALGGAGSLRKFSPMASGTKGASKLHKTAKKVFGTTDDPTKGGYIIEDGSMLDLSQSAPLGHTLKAHSEITRISDPAFGGLKEYKNLDKSDFMNSGAVRMRTFGGATSEEMRYLKIDPSNVPSWYKTEPLFIFDMNTMPTNEQFRKMQNIYNDVIGKGSKVQVSARTVAPANVLWRQKEYQMGRNPDWENSLDVEYDIKNSWNKVKNDIIKYFETGRGPSTVQQFR